MPATRATTEGGVPERARRGLWTRGRSRPVPQQFPRYLKPLRLLPQRTLEPRHPLPGVLQLLLTRIPGALPRGAQRLGAALQQTVTPPLVQRLGDLVLATDVAHAPSPRRPASTISAFRSGDHFRRSRFSLTRPTPKSHEQPSPKPTSSGNRQRTTRVQVRRLRSRSSRRAAHRPQGRAARYSARSRSRSFETTPRTTSSGWRLPATSHARARRTAS